MTILGDLLNYCKVEWRPEQPHPSIYLSVGSKLWHLPFIWFDFFVVVCYTWNENGCSSLLAWKGVPFCSSMNYLHGCDTAGSILSVYVSLSSGRAVRKYFLKLKPQGGFRVFVSYPNSHEPGNNIFPPPLCSCLLYTSEVLSCSPHIKLNSPVSCSLSSLGAFSRPLAILTALFWTPSSFSPSCRKCLA